MKMKKHIKTYDRYEVVLVPFPFIDVASTRQRPALVLSSSRYFNIKIGSSVMAMITTAGHYPWPFDVAISQLENAGLSRPSIVRMKLFTLDHRLILKKIGILHKADQQSVAEGLRGLFNY
jgi:mRNA interferase MazF